MRLETINALINALNVTSNDCTRMELVHVLIEKQNGVILKFNKNKKDSPIIVSIRGSQSSNGVLMPMRK